MAGDCTDIAPLWIPASWTLIASDLVFTDCHVWIAHSSSAMTLCSGQQKLATTLEFFQYRFSDSLGGNPPLYSCGLSAL